MSKNGILPNVPTYSSERFTWHNRRGITDISDLGGPHAVHSRLWSDSSDVGFWIRSRRTGQTIAFVLIFQKRSEGEVVSNVYTSIGLLLPVDVTLIND